jgi:hypothetical protein
MKACPEYKYMLGRENLGNPQLACVEDGRGLGCTLNLACSPSFAVSKGSGLYTQTFEAECVATGPGTSAWQYSHSGGTVFNGVCQKAKCPNIAPTGSQAIDLNRNNEVLITQLHLPIPGCICPVGQYGFILPTDENTGTEETPNYPGWESSCANPAPDDQPTTLDMKFVFDISFTSSWYYNPTSFRYYTRVRDYFTVMLGLQFEDVVLTKARGEAKQPGSQVMDATALYFTVTFPSRAAASSSLDKLSALGGGFVPLTLLGDFGQEFLIELPNMRSISSLPELDGSLQQTPSLTPLAGVALLAVIELL